MIFICSCLIACFSEWISWSSPADLKSVVSAWRIAVRTSNFWTSSKTPNFNIYILFDNRPSGRQQMDFLCSPTIEPHFAHRCVLSLQVSTQQHIRPTRLNGSSRRVQQTVAVPMWVLMTVMPEWPHWRQATLVELLLKLASFGSSAASLTWLTTTTDIRRGVTSRVSRNGWPRWISGQAHIALFERRIVHSSVLIEKCYSGIIFVLTPDSIKYHYSLILDEFFWKTLISPSVYLTFLLSQKNVTIMMIRSSNIKPTIMYSIIWYSSFRSMSRLYPTIKAIDGIA